MNISSYIIKQAQDAIRRGDVIIYPTDTLYALGADATNPEAVAKIFTLKKREQNNPLSIAVGTIADIEKYAVMTPLAHSLAKKFLPGPLTLVLKKKQGLAPNLTPDDTIAIRVIDHPLFKDLNVPLTATSANISGEETSASAMEIANSLESENIAVVLDEGLLSGVPSTIIDARGETPVILRVGAIRTEELQ